jgi:hypothetical protein
VTASAAPVAIIWDGSHHVAAIWREGGELARFLAAEEAGGRVSLIAASEAGDGVLTGILPPGSRVVHAVALTPEGMQAIPAQLDERLSLAEADRGASGLALVQARLGGPGLLCVETSPASATKAAADGLAASGFNQLGGAAAEGGLRLLVGPFLHPDDERATVTRLSATRGEGLSLVFQGEEGASGDAIASGVLVAHLPAAMREARQALGQIDQDLRLAIEAELDMLASAPADQRDSDASGLGRVAALRRGFRLLRPALSADGGCRLDLPEWSEADDIIVFAEPRRHLVWAGEGQPVAGAPMTLRWQEGAFSAVSHRETYAASAATGLTLGGQRGNALVLAAPGASAPLHDDLALAARRLADGLWQASELRPARLGAVLQEISAARQAGAPSGPLARLDAQAKSAAGSLLEALAGAAGIDPSRADELGERPLGEQVAMVMRALAQPRLTARACAIRMLLPAPGGSDDAEIERLVGWYEDPGLPQSLAREAMALAGHDRRAMRLLHDIAASAHQSWLGLAEVAEVEQVVAEAAARRGQKRLSPLDALLAGLRRQAPRQAGPAAAPGLEEIARMRAQLVLAAEAAGETGAIRDELERRLGELTPGEIVLLHGHFAGLRRDAEQGLAATALIQSWEAAAGYPGLAARAHRSGEALRGAERLAAASRSFCAALATIDGLAPALSALAAEIDAVLGPAEHATERGRSLRTTLEAYSRLLLAQLALREADAAFAAIPFAARALADPQDTGFGAAYRRLRAGAGDTLARYLAAAAAVSGIDHRWGVTLAGGTAARPDA